jgi:hypothetical protein
MARRIFNAETANKTVESYGMEGGPQSGRTLHVSGTIGTGTIAVAGRPTGSGAAYTPLRVRSLGVTTETFVTTIVALGNYIIEDAGNLDIQYTYVAAGGSSITMWEQEHA